MSKEEKKIEEENERTQSYTSPVEESVGNPDIPETPESPDNPDNLDNPENPGNPEETPEDKLALAEARIAELEKERLYKQAEFDNYRKRIIKEKAELILNGGRKVLEAMLPVIDDLERALSHIGNTENAENAEKTESTEVALREGVDLIYKKFLKVMEAQGVTQMKTDGADFNTDFHEAVTQFPAPTPELKGKVIDCTEKGYMLNDTVLRYAKVVVGI